MGKVSPANDLFPDHPLHPNVLKPWEATFLNIATFFFFLKMCGRPQYSLVDDRAGGVQACPEELESYREEILGGLLPDI